MTSTTDPRPLDGKVALVAGATRGAGRAIAVELARAGAYVYATGRSSRVNGPSEIKRTETIEDTGDLIGEVGAGRALRVDHLEPAEVQALVSQIDAEHGALHLLVNDIFGGDAYAQFGTRLWEHDLSGGLRMLRMGIDTHAITSHYALPLLIKSPGGLVVEMTDGTDEYNAEYRHDVGFFYDLVKAPVQRMTLAQNYELRPHGGACVAVTPGWLRSEAMLDIFGVTEQNWAMPRALNHTSASPNRRASSDALLPTSPQVPTSRVSPAGPRRVASSRPCTASPTTTARAPIAGGTSPRSSRPICPLTTPDIDDY